MKEIEIFLNCVNLFFLVYLLLYTTYLFLSVLVGAFELYKKQQRYMVRNQLKHEYYVPVSLLVPAYNEEVTIVDSINSLVQLNYNLFEIIIINDGSKDNTLNKLIEAFSFVEVKRPIHIALKTAKLKAVYETRINGVSVTLIDKENGGKGDSLNMGINASRFPYFICIDADSMLQKDSLEKIVQPLMEDDRVVAVGGLIRVAQCVEMKDGEVTHYRMPINPILGMQVVEYDRSFLASRILMDQFNGNLIISGAFGLFKKDVVVACGGYDSHTLGEDMELVVRLHVFCRNNMIDYAIKYEPNAICWSQAPGSLKDLVKQRRRWHLGLFQSMLKHYKIFCNFRFGLVSIISYMYYLLYELLSPVIEVLGITTIIISGCVGLLNPTFMIRFLLLYSLYGAILTITAFFQRIYTQNLRISLYDTIKAVIICILENVFFRYVLSFIRVTSFIGYRKKKNVWGSIQRFDQKTFK
ncbi:glycosyltransferase family 2 protein [Thomasclavelia sp.]|uniref:glycosyltransferase family 2 protein n=1 Tax=Thomasclavelia sp. TaxID=3025757 RepID=UPI0025F1E489|nr:glycosyltransferase family 2 protein [Thomasclavelia sp.]